MEVFKFFASMKHGNFLFGKIDSEIKQSKKYNYP